MAWEEQAWYTQGMSQPECLVWTIEVSLFLLTLHFLLHGREPLPSLCENSLSSFCPPMFPRWMNCSTQDQRLAASFLHQLVLPSNSGNGLSLHNEQDPSDLNLQIGELRLSSRKTLEFLPNVSSQSHCFQLKAIPPCPVPTAPCKMSLPRACRDGTRGMALTCQRGD